MTTQTLRRTLFLTVSGIIAAFVLATSLLVVRASPSATTNVCTLPGQLIATDDFTYEGDDIVVDGCAGIIEGVHNFNSLMVVNSGLLRHRTGVTTGMRLTITNDVLIEAGSVIDVSGRGYAGGPPNGTAEGPGAGIWGDGHGGGGGHGGNGAGRYNFFGQYSNAGLAYGDLYRPVTSGSGGAGCSANAFCSGPGGAGGNGGGALYLNVGGTMTVLGGIYANGANAVSVSGIIPGSGGAGGSVWITASSLVGNGYIHANGGNGAGGYNRMGGGGGRIAVYYGSSSFSGALSAQGGQTNYEIDQPSGIFAAGAGTIYLRDNDEPRGSLIIANRPLENALLPNVATTPLDGGPVTAAEPHAFNTFDITGSALVGTHRPVTVTNGSSFAPGFWAIQGGFDGVTTTVGAGLSISHTLATTATSTLFTSRFDGLLSMDAAADLLIGRGIWLELQTPLSLDEVWVGNGGRLGHVFLRDGISPTLTIVANMMTIEAGSQVNVGARGYRGSSAASGVPGAGPGGGLWSGESGSGAGYGGPGGGPGGGPVYGDPNMPLFLGSGGSGSGGGGGSSAGRGGHGGGRVHLIISGPLSVDGGIYANGGSSVNMDRDGGGGAGGSIWIQADALAGSGAIQANGGSGQNTGGGGGGGRIAINTSSDSFVGTVRVNGGSGGFGAGGRGTVVPDNLFGVAQVATPEPASYGGELVYTLRVSNNGTSAVTTTITNTFSADVTPTGQQSWNANIDPGQTWTEMVTVTVAANATDPVVNLLEASVAGQTRSVSLQTPLEDVPISGLTANNDSPTLDGGPVNFNASVTAGSNVAYDWNFGDGVTGSGSFTDHVYDAPGVYTATVTASNSRGSAAASTAVTVEPLPNFRGTVFADSDGDGLQGVDEPGLPGVLVTADGPAGSLNDTSASNGSWRIDSGDAGVYIIAPSLAGYTSTSDAPVQVALPNLGSTYVNFGMAPVPAPGAGAIVGRAFGDGNGNGAFDTAESGFSGVTVTLLSGGGPVDTVTTVADGSYSFPNVAPGLYAVAAEAPATFFPATLLNEDLSVASGQIASAQFGFVGGSDLVGTVNNGGGYPVPGITLVLTQEDAPAQTAVTDADGAYAFLDLGPGSYSLAIELPVEYQLPDGQDEREVIILGDSQTVEDWVVNRQGRVYLRAFLDNQIPFVPVGGSTFVISGTNGFSAAVTTDGNGQAIVDGLSSGVYTVTPQLDPNDGFSVSPQQRVVQVALDGSAFLDFFFDFPRTIRALCQRSTGSAAGPAFPCIVTATVISGTAGAPGTVVDTIQLNGERTALFTELDTGTYRITITPDPAVVGQAAWPVHEEVVALNDGDNRVVAYPYNPTSATTRIWGYAFYDRNQDGVRQDFGGTMFSAQDEAHDNAANGMVVSLYNAGSLVMTTTTTIHGQYEYGWYAFDGVPAGEYLVEISLRSGLFPTTASSVVRIVDFTFPPAPAQFGYIKQFGSHIGGLVFYDNNGNGEPDPEIDDPLGSVELILRDVGGADVETTTSNAYGSYTFYPLPSGEYTVVLIAPTGSGSATTLAHPVAVPDGDSAVTLHYALPPDDGRTRAIVYIDQNFNGEPDDEEAMSGVVLYREPGSCNNLVGPSGNGVAAVSDGDGLGLFPPVSQSGCVTVDLDSLPPGVAPAQQALPAPGGSGFVWVRLLPAGTVNISPFWDKDGDGSRDAGEPVVAGATVSIPNVGMQPVGVAGATFSLEENSYAVTVNPPGNMTVAAPMPLTVVATSGGSSAYDVPLRYTGQVAGALLSSGGSPTWANLQVILEDLQNGSFYFATISQSDSYYQFNNLQPSTYRLRLANVPSGWALASEPTFGYLAGMTVNQNLTLLRLGSVSGEVFLDQNGNGVRDNGEPATGQYDVTLTNNAGQPDVTVDVAADGTFAVPNLVPGVQYAVTSDLGWGGGGGAPGSAITAAPGWFTVDSSGASVTIGIYPYAYDPDANDYNTVFGRVYEQIGTVKNPHAGAVISYWTWSQGTGCSVVSGVLGTAVSDNDGYYRILTDWIPDMQKIYCIQVTELPGLEQNQQATAPFSFYYQSTSGMVFYPGIRERDLIVSPIDSSRSVSAPSLSWHAFRDDNGNGIRDGQEPALPDVVAGNGTISVTTDINGDGMLTGLPVGEQLLAVVAPDGYVSASGRTFPVWLDGADVTLGGLPFRLDGWLSGSLFGDADGDGHRSADELGIGNVTITFSGPMMTSTVTALDGSFALPNLPDGTYQVTLTPPAGFAPLLAQSISLESGGALQLPLRPVGLVGGVVYQDWDGDGQRLPDEDLVSHPLTMTLSNGAEMLLAGGKFLFWNLASGSYTVTPLWSAVLPATVDTATGGVVALPVVPGGTVRGTVWHDVNGDGLRQSGEVPLGGVQVSVAGQDGVTDANGRFQFLNVITGTHTVSVALPGSLEAELDQVTVSGLRGAVVGVATAVPTTHTLFLPIVVAGGGQQATIPVLAQTSVPVAEPLSSRRQR